MRCHRSVPAARPSARPTSYHGRSSGRGASSPRASTRRRRGPRRASRSSAAGSACRQASGSAPRWWARPTAPGPKSWRLGLATDWTRTQAARTPRRKARARASRSSLDRSLHDRGVKVFEDGPAHRDRRALDASYDARAGEKRVMRIFEVAPFAAPIDERGVQLGGAQVLIADLAHGLASRGHAVTLAAANGSFVSGVTLADLDIESAGLRRADLGPRD